MLDSDAVIRNDRCEVFSDYSNQYNYVGRYIKAECDGIFNYARGTCDSIKRPEEQEDACQLAKGRQYSLEVNMCANVRYVYKSCEVKHVGFYQGYNEGVNLYTGVYEFLGNRYSCPPIECGTGFHEKDGKCEPDFNCPEGTTWTGTSCLAPEGGENNNNNNNNNTGNGENNNNTENGENNNNNNTENGENNNNTENGENNNNNNSGGGGSNNSNSGNNTTGGGGNTSGTTPGGGSNSNNNGSGSGNNGSGSGNNGSGGEGEGEGEGENTTAGNPCQGDDCVFSDPGKDAPAVPSYGDTFTKIKNGISNSPIGQSVSGIRAPSGGACPAPSFSAFGQSFTIDAHCTLFAQNEHLIRAMFLAFWALLAVIVFLSA